MNVDKMMRSITAAQFQELSAFAEMQPLSRGEGRLDMRFALLSSDVVGALGRPHSAVRFIRALREAERFEAEEIDKEVVETPQPTTSKQTLEQQQMHIDAWVMGSNKVFEEKRKGVTRG